jgi:hypothetical protein
MIGTCYTITLEPCPLPFHEDVYFSYQEAKEKRRKIYLASCWQFGNESVKRRLGSSSLVTIALKKSKVSMSLFISSVNLLYLYLSVKRSHHVRREGLEIPTLIQKREEYTPLDFMKIWRSKLIQRIHKFGIKIRKSKESVFNTNTINKYINSK